MGQALYRKYRSKSLSEIVGQERITATLEKAVQTGRISHAYLFTGPHGVGKTSIARILAHEINGLPYTDESAHLDIIEIDAASNRRIDEIRELRDKVYVAPTSAKYKVYIIDEVHMLTREAFNALLKTLEEPPAHAVFILATTDAHKLPETIVSRTQRFSFKPVEKDKVIGHLKHIAKQEKINISDEALALLAEHGEGSFRDSISLLDQASSRGETIGADEIRQLLGIPPEESLSALLAALHNHDNQLALQTLLGLYDQGYQAAGIAKQLARRLRQELVAAPAGSRPVLELLAKLIEVPVSHDPERYLEIVLLDATLPAGPAVAATAGPPAAPAPKSVPAPEPPKLPPAEAPAPKAQVKAEVKEETVAAAPAEGSVIDEANWPMVLDALKKKHNTLYGIVRMAHPSFATPGKIELGFAFAFHQKRIMDAKNRKILADIIEQVSGQSVEISCTLDKDLLAAGPKPPAKAAAAKDSEELTTISNIFGGGELLES